MTKSPQMQLMLDRYGVTTKRALLAAIAREYTVETGSRFSQRDAELILDGMLESAYQRMQSEEALDPEYSTTVSADVVERNLRAIAEADDLSVFEVPVPTVSAPLAALRRHVSGAIAAGLAEPIVAVETEEALEHESHGGAAGSFAAEGCSLCPVDEKVDPLLAAYTEARHAVSKTKLELASQIIATARRLAESGPKRRDRYAYKATVSHAELAELRKLLAEWDAR